MSDLSRRQFGKIPAAVAAVVASTLTSGTAMAASDRIEAIPDNVSITFPREELRQHQPKLVLPEESAQKYQKMYAWKVTSQEYRYDVLVYWSSYSHQEGASKYDSHWGDHEPIYLFLSDSGELRDVRYSAYHWYAGAGLPTTGADDHPLFGVVDPWHNHYLTTNETDAELTELAPLGTKADLTDENTSTAFENWLANGLEEDLAPVVTRPERMLTRGHWWAEDVAGISFEAMRVAVDYLTGQDGADRVEPVDIWSF